MLLIGLTGGIASGKTLVSDTFANLGVPIVDADLLAREVVSVGSPGLESLAQIFGEKILDSQKALDRAALRNIIFNDGNARAQVDALLHPMIRDLAKSQIEDLAKNDHPYVIHAIPLLVETGQSSEFDRVVVVDIPTQLQIERLQKRDGISEEQAIKILESQASRSERLAIANDIIDNSGSIEETVLQVTSLHEIFLQLSEN